MSDLAAEKGPNRTNLVLISLFLVLILLVFQLPKRASVIHEMHLFRPYYLAKLLPGYPFYFEMKGQTMSIVVTKDDGGMSTVSFDPPRAGSLSNIQCPGHLEGVTVGRDVNGGHEVLVTFRDSGAGEHFNVVVLEPEGGKYSWHLLPELPKELEGSAKGKEFIRASEDHIEMGFVDSENHPTAQNFWFDYGTNQWSAGN